MLSFSLWDVLDMIFDLIESVSEGLPNYSFLTEIKLSIHMNNKKKL